MRKILIVASVILTLCACSKEPTTPEDKARALIKEYINNNLGDPASYESIVLGPIDSIFNRPYYDLAQEQYKQIYDSLDYARIAAKRLNLLDLAIETTNKLTDLIDTFLESQDTLSVEHYGYGAIHKFRVANTLGGKEIYMFYIEFDKEIGSIIYVDTVTMQDIYNYKEVLDAQEEEYEALSDYEKADYRRVSNMINTILN